MTEKYKNLFQSDELASRYEISEYAPSSGSSLYWEVEKAFLIDFIRGLSSSEKASYLDFACGTGRIIQIVENLVPRAEGIDLSSSMLKIAADKVKNARLICMDIDQDHTDNFKQKYDLITSFRFFPNVEPEIRHKALKWLASSIKTGGIMIINTHLNPISLKALVYPYHALMSLLFKRPKPKYLSTSEIRVLLAMYGFTLERIYGLGFISGRLVSLLPFKFACAIEKTLAGSVIANHFGFNLIYICRRIK